MVNEYRTFLEVEMFKRERDMDELKVCFFDLLCVLCSYCFTISLPHNDLSRYSMFMIGFLHVVVFYIGNHYDSIYKRGYLDEIKVVFTYQVEMVISMMVLTFVSKGLFNISRRGIMYFTIFNFIFVYLSHVLVKQYRVKLYPNKTKSKKVYLVTTIDRLSAVFQKVEKAGAWGGKITAIALFDDDKRVVKEYKGIPVVANRQDYIAYAQYEVVDEVFIHLPNEYDLDMEMIVSQFEMMGARVSFSINSFDLGIDCEKRVTQLAGFNVITFSTSFHQYRDVLLKRAIDICGAIVGLAITGIVAIVLVPLIKLESSGPAIFSQKRVGKNGRVFKFYKFRSMYEDAEQRKQELLDQNEVQGLMFKMENDPRITKVGKFIRRTSLDELPQFYNVLIGDMSLVGTRPPTIDEYRQYEPSQKRRLSAKPGITGMWQVSGRSNIKDFSEVVKLDLEYIDNWSVWLDIKIIIKTVGVLIGQDGAR